MILHPGGHRSGDGFHSARVDGRQVPHPPPDLPLEGGGDELPRPGEGLSMDGQNQPCQVQPPRAAVGFESPLRCSLNKPPAMSEDLKGFDRYGGRMSKIELQVEARR
jgi:hypothetical protein